MTTNLTTQVTQVIAEFAVGPAEVPASLAASSIRWLDRCESVAQAATSATTGGDAPWPAELRRPGHPSTLERAFSASWALASLAGADPVEPAIPIAAAVWAVAEASGGGPGPQSVTAVSVGREIAHRFLVVLGPMLSDRGWDPQRLTAGIGASVAVARALHLDVERAVAAVALAATQAAGLRVTHPSRLSCAQWAKAALDGVASGELAGLGFTAPPAPIEGRRGLVALLAPEVDPVDLVGGLGEQWWVDLP